MRRMLRHGWLAMFAALPLLACSALETLGRAPANQLAAQAPQVIYVPTPVAAQAPAVEVPEVAVVVEPVVTTAATAAPASQGRPTGALDGKQE